MGVVFGIILERAVPEAIDLEALREAAIDRCGEAAESRNIYYSDCLRNLSLYEAHEPDPTEVACHLGEDKAGDWRAAMQVAATLAMRGHLEAEVEADVSRLQGAIAEASRLGFEAKDVHPTCVHGWVAHDRETDWEHGTLYEWTSRGGAWDAAMLRVGLSGGTWVWIDLAWAG